MAGDQSAPVLQDPVATRSLPVLLSGMSTLANQYEGFIVDLWGVVHDGVRAYAAALDVLQRLRQSGRKVCFLSNSPRLVDTIVLKLAAMGIGSDCFDHLVSSGEAARTALRERPDAWHAALGERYFFMGPADAKKPLLQGLNYTEVRDPAEAHFIVNAGSEPGLSIDDYEALLRQSALRRLPMICANPDLEVYIGNQLVMCAGQIARRYERLGGDVRYHGKPYPAAYHECLAFLRLERSAILAIGDGLETDVAGANNAGIDAAFVMDGLYRQHLTRDGAAGRLPEQLERLMVQGQHRPKYALPQLAW